MTAHEPVTHEDVAELISLYAMDAASPDEARVVERHVARCGACHAELQSLFEAAGALSWAPQQLAMPTSVRARVLAKIDAEDVSRRGAVARPVAAAPTKLGRLRRPFGSFGFAMPMAACLALVVVALGVQTMRLSNDNRSSSPKASASLVSSMTGTSHVVRISTRGQLDGVHAEYADVHGVGLIVTKGLPAPPKGYVYRVWGVTPTHAMHDMGALTPHTGANQMGLQPINAPKPGSVKSIEITLEQASEAPMRPAGPVVGSAEMV